MCALLLLSSLSQDKECFIFQSCTQNTILSHLGFFLEQSEKHFAVICTTNTMNVRYTELYHKCLEDSESAANGVCSSNLAL